MDKVKTYWNGERTDAERVVVIVGNPPSPTHWYADIVGQERNAVEIRYGDQLFYIDDEDGTGWTKVTEGKGMPEFFHRNLTVERVLNIRVVLTPRKSNKELAAHALMNDVEPDGTVKVTVFDGKTVMPLDEYLKSGWVLMIGIHRMETAYFDHAEIKEENKDGRE